MKNCIVCQGQAEVFCHQDEAYLCLTCDEQVHSANLLARRHQRTKLCELCTSAPSTVYCKNDKAHLCATCDVDAHTGIVNCRHERVPVTSTAAPSEVEEGDGCSQVKGGDARSEVNNMDDGTDDSLWAVPDGSSAPARPSATGDDFPDWNRTSLPIDAKSLLGEEFQQEMDIFDMDPAWLDRLDMGFDDLADSLLDDLPCDMGGKPMLKRKGSNNAVRTTSDNTSSCSPPCVPTFAPRPVKLQRVSPADIMSTAELLATYQESNNADAQRMVFQHQQPVSAQQMVPNHQESSVAVSMASYAAAPVPYTAPAPMYHTAPVVEATHHHAHHRDHRFMTQPLEAEKIDVSTYIPRSLQPTDPTTAAARAADRTMRLNRFREKKKNRQFKKTIRYASRKAYAEVRPRIKGRFARKDEVVAMRAAGVLPQLAA